MTAAPQQGWLLRSQAIAAAQRWQLRSQKGTPKFFAAAQPQMANFFSVQAFGLSVQPFGVSVQALNGANGANAALSARSALGFCVQPSNFSVQP